jgi:hypothetical protein
VVESGTMGLFPDLDSSQSYFYVGQPGETSGGGMAVQEGVELLLTPGNAVYDSDGDLGVVRNAGLGELRVLVLAIVPGMSEMGEPESPESP